VKEKGRTKERGTCPFGVVPDLHPDREAAFPEKGVIMPGIGLSYSDTLLAHV
jgi:hypothetical protein